MTKPKLVVFDLDDTLFKEIDFLKSAFKEIANWLKDSFDVDGSYSNMIIWYSQKQNVFEELNRSYKLNLPISTYLEIYRNHVPSITLNKETKTTLATLKQQGHQLGIITDGRSVTQRNKIRSLGLTEFIKEEDILISEEFGATKPEQANYLFFSEKYSGYQAYYVGDNIQKDFLAPNRLGWKTIGLLDDGSNIHQQDYSMPVEYLPQVRIAEITEILKFL